MFQKARKFKKRKFPENAKKPLYRVTKKYMQKKIETLKKIYYLFKKFFYVRIYM